MSVYAFGPFDKPTYSATVSSHLKNVGHRNSGSSNTCWCCPFGKGHRTPRAAAQHAARLMEEAWANEPVRDAYGYPVAP